MFRKNSFSIQINKRIFIPRVASIIAMVIAMVLSGCFYSSSDAEEAIVERNAAADEEFEKEYEAAQKKYEKYLNGPISGQEVLNLIDNWDETDFKMTVENIEDQRFRVSNLDKDDTIFKYWDKESCYYIDPDAFYKGGFFFGSSTGREKVKRRWIRALNFSLVDDPSLSDDNTTENND
ncbi:MAG: hypothetical protein J6X36_00615 [Lachnospiraceae bacterium]|nr:hypothetical protein [Lachnospiraceae bacterium]